MKLIENNSVNLYSKQHGSRVIYCFVVDHSLQTLAVSIVGQLDDKCRLQLGFLNEVCKLVIRQQYVVKDVQSPTDDRSM